MAHRLSSTLVHALVVLSLFTQGFVLVSPRQKEIQIPAPAVDHPCAGVLYDFDRGLQGWAAADYSDRYSSLEVSRNTDVPVGKGSLALRLVLNNSRPSAEFLVDLSNDPPACAKGADPKAPLWEPGSVLSVWVWAPKGALGDPNSANGVHLFAIDSSGRKLYGPWQSIRENTWFEVTLELDEEEIPTCGSKGVGFDPTRIDKIGLNIGVNTNVDNPIRATFRIAGVSIQTGELPSIPSDHQYSFNSAAEQEMLPRWERRNQSWQADAFTSLHLEDGALVAGTNFITGGGDASRKGVISLISAPPLDLSLQKKTEILFSVDIGFESSMEQNVHCPFGLTLWLFDEGKKSWYTSAYENVGSTYWTRVAFPLSALRSQEYPNTSIDLTRIGELALQVWGNSDYRGKIRFDNIALGNVTPLQTLKEPKDGSAKDFLTTEGPHFRLGEERFRFIGANTEYLPFVSNVIVEDVLDRASSMGITVIRTWGFGDGCEDKHLEGCIERSRYFQPAPGIYNESAFEHFDRIVLEAKERGLRLIVPLVNNWPEYGGIPQYVCWQKAYNPTNDPACSTRLMSDKLHDMFYTDPAIKSLYRDYVQHFVNRVNPLTGIAYKNDPTIMAWELINEPRAPSDPSGETLHAWIAEMSTYLAALAPRQLIGTGEEGWYIMSRESANDFEKWQNFPNNYWHYGVNWTPDACTESWGSNGVDFLSNHSSIPRMVTWQETVGKNDSELLSTQRRGVPDVDYTTIHLYPAPGETSLSSAPYCDYPGLDSLCATKDHENGFVSPNHQAKEWIARHVETSHKILNKPFILEEFNFPVLQGEEPAERTDQEGLEFQVAPRERALLFEQYLEIAYDLDVDGVMFWNLGYDGFADQPWLEVPSLMQWKQPSSASPDSEADNPGSNAAPAGIRMDYDPAQGFEEATMVLPDLRVDWLRANGNQVFVNLQNDGDARSVIFRVRLSNGEERASEEYSLGPGENHINLDALFKSLPKPKSIGDCELPEVEPPHIIGMVVKLRDYTSKGSAYFDFHTVFNNKYVIYPGDPVEEIIRLAAPHW